MSARVVAYLSWEFRVSEIKFSEPKLSRYRLRAYLIKLHKDLFSVHALVCRSGVCWPNGMTNIEKAVLVLEDRRFFSHHGFDFKALIRELMKAALGRKHGGASTIDMQFVRTATGFRNRTIGRKTHEILMAFIVHFRYTKKTILRSYLDAAYFGSRLHGVHAAANKIFGCSAEQLSMEQAFFVASMLLTPRPLNPCGKWYSRVKRRADYGVSVYVRDQKSFDKLWS